MYDTPSRVRERDAKLVRFYEVTRASAY